MKGSRTDRLGEEIRHEISEVLQRRMRDPRLGMVAVTRVEVSADLGHARVFVSSLGDEAEQRTTLRVLSRANGFIRRELASRLRVRRVPELDFRADPGIRHSVHIQQVLQELGLDEPSAPSEEGDAGSEEDGQRTGGSGQEGSGERVSPPDGEAQGRFLDDDTTGEGER